MMKELSMHIIDIVQNSIRANAKNILVYVEEDNIKNKFIIRVDDDGEGMDEDFLKYIKDPFKTTRTTRKVGLGIPMLAQTCEFCGGALTIESEKKIGTRITAEMDENNIDRPPLGDIINSMHQLIIMNEEIDFVYKHIKNGNIYEFDTKEIKEVLDGVPFKELEVSSWIKANISEGLEEIGVK